MPLDVWITPAISSVDAAAWDALVGDDNPFVEHAFLWLLETSGSVGASTGWAPAYVLVRRGKRLVGALPSYLRGDSQGEYIFDWAWADAAERAGLTYYPKITVGVPFTPATGPRLLVHPDEASEGRRDEVREALLAGLDALVQESGASSVHVLFCLDEEAEFLERRGFSRRATHQFHWRNDGYERFDGEGRSFTSALRSQARKQIRKERQRAREGGLSLEWRAGDALSPEEWQRLDALYRHTSGRKWGSPYLTPAFFAQARHTIGHRARVLFAREGEEIVAASLSFEKGRHLYGRYWGSFVEHDCLHFELCYYQLIEHAIERGLTLVEAGAQGPHKWKRGFVPVVTHSAHRMVHPGLHDAVARANEAERRSVEAQVAAAACEGPFREGAAPALPLRAGLAEDAARQEGGPL